MRSFFLILLIHCLVCPLVGGAESETPPTADLQKNVVVVRSYQQSHDWLIPWNKKTLRQIDGAALVLSQQQLLTTAELVSNHTLIEVRKPGDSNPYEAEVILLDYGINLALLYVPDPMFWHGLSPVRWGALEKGSGDVVYWKNKNEWKSVEANIKQLFIGYRGSSQSRFPIIEVIASLKSDAQGNPLVQNDRIVGMVMQKRDANLDVFPASFLQAFVERTTRQPYQSFPQRGFGWQEIPQETVRDYLQIEKSLSGVLIDRIWHYGTGSDVLQPFDFLVAMAGWEISNEGKIEHPQWGNVLFDFIFAELHAEDSLTLEVVRKSKRITLRSKLAEFPANRHSVPLTNVLQPPRYVLRGGLLFQELNMNYLQLWGKEWRSKAPVRLSIYQQLESQLAENKNRRLVLLTRVLPAPINIGYQNLNNLIVAEINDQPIHMLTDVIHAFQQPKGLFHQVKFLPGANRAFLILPVDEMQETDQRILQHFQIPQLERL